MKTLIIIPTYNEVENIAEIIKLIRRDVRSYCPDILVVDSNSPDGTAHDVETLQKTDAGLHLIVQPQKVGLGKAYLEGMNWALARDYETIVTMDADFSHNPSHLNELLAMSNTTNFVIGSRYIKGGGLNAWPFHRRLLSRGANLFAKLVTALPFNDCTSGFQAVHKKILAGILSQPIVSDGYAFQIELKYRGLEENASFSEIPIVFTNRTRGTSKISRKIIVETFFYVLSLFPKRNMVEKRLESRT